MALWTQGEQQMIRPIDPNNYAKFDMLQTEVEYNDLPKIIGTDFYQELLRNTENYSVLLNGGTYTTGGYQYRFKGLKFVCAYLLYARYVRESYMQDTFSGFVQHTNDNQRGLSAGELQNQETRYKEIAGSAWDECKKYLETLSLEWFPSCQTRKIKIDYL